MKKRTSIRVAAVLLFIVAITCLWTVYGTHTVSLTAAQIQEQVSKQVGKEFVVKGASGLLIKQATIASATVNLEGGSLETLVDIKGALRGGKQFSLSVHALGMPKYDAGSFYFLPDKVEVRKFAYQDSAPSEIITGLAKKYLGDGKMKQIVTDAAPKVESWMTSTAENAAMYSLGKNPVYKLGGDIKGTLIRGALQSVKIEQSKIVIVFSLWTLSISVISGIFFFAIGIAMLFVASQSRYGDAAGVAVDVASAAVDVLSHH